jgi:hypothetical protein
MQSSYFLGLYAICSGQILRGTKWGTFLRSLRRARSAPPSFCRTKSLLHRPRGSRQSVCHGQAL